MILKKSLEFQGIAPKEFLRKPHHDDLPVFLSSIMDPTKGEDESSCITNWHQEERISQKVSSNDLMTDFF